MHGTNPILFTGSAEQRGEMLQRARMALERDRDLRNQILRRDWLSPSAKERKIFADAGASFSKAAAEIITLTSSGSSADVGREREKTLRPMYERYVAATTDAADALEAEGLRKSYTITTSTGTFSRVMLGAASWPLMLLSLFLLVTAIFVIVVLLNVFVRKREAI